MTVNNVLQEPAVSAGVTVVAYWISLKIAGRFRWAHPLVVSCAILMILLWRTHLPFALYRHGGDKISWFLGPATVALAVPMYKHGYQLRGRLVSLTGVVLVGALVGMITASVTAWLLGASRSAVMSTVPKSVTTPIAIEISRQLHGHPEITVVMVILTGILGSIVGPHLLKALGIQDDRAIGLAMGTSSHAVGTASLVHRSEVQASVSSWAMAAAGILTAMMAVLISLFL